ncbi:ATP-binding cassette domain-containing protein [Aliivibrio fischeri]|uniref:ABC transporter ATP-binding protein n=1 Tax=Aliivibrio fischeri TaxID=668 RepID=UPI0012D86CFF|nr:ABC transporter ATP-binding protein [Aliivibrio fischeri]MUK61880.1 ATP-binding cassette domain-containing protein [Aliivibrio fischeri]MUK69316.1 ATP-binding cassette domain-containing protein [Aliivibrio fischeri]MUK75119.1 ATP-binding cassette domain-containing protein [Aliivibrio fischeri]MUL21849.1 ATP-binding cassette domain-containing protein [Aliivibrio fischeri]MUL25936.1 ATP-binding cassette domain-containing protein [Aliivibrio fischeri]
MTVAIKVSSVGKSVISNEAELTILKDVSFEVQSGQSVAIVGTSGAGKSTLMTLLAGLDTPSTGDIELLGKSLSQMDDEARAQIRSESIGFVFQSFLLIPSLTALENVTLPAILRGEGEDIKKAKQLLDSVGLSGRETHLPSQLSGGEQQRVALARAFMTQPKILFADEPTGNLDQHTAEHIIELLFEMNQKHGTTLVLITHDPKLAERCERTLTIDAGQIREEVK